MSRIRKLTAVAASAVLLGGAGLGAAHAATQSSGTPGTSSAQTQKKRPGLTTAQLSQVASKLGVTSAQLKAALRENRPAKPAGQRGDRLAAMAAAIAKELGVETSQVTSILEANRPERPATRPAPGTRPAKPDRSKLVSVLASGLGIDQATVKAALTKLETAHKAEHEARHAAMVAAIATSLNLDASDVEAAFASVRPSPPRG